MNIARIIRKLKAVGDILPGNAKYSYSQYGEDLLVDAFFTQYQNKPNPTYLDIGTNHPVGGNNTYIFYLKKCKGVCVEPDARLYQLIKAKRPNDTVLNAAIGIDDTKEGTLYSFPDPYSGWNTFSKSDADLKQSQTGVKYNSDHVIPFLNINDIIEKHFGQAPDFISIDVEGLDLELLKTLDFNKYQPSVFCVETMEFNNLKLGVKDQPILDFMKEKGYAVYADTYINTIFVHKNLLP